MIRRPRFRLPIWSAVVLIGAGYLARAWLWKNGDLSPELPSDGVALAALVVGISIVAWMRHSARDDEDRECGTDEPRTPEGD